MLSLSDIPPRTLYHDKQESKTARKNLTVGIILAENICKGFHRETNYVIGIRKKSYSDLARGLA